MELSKYLADLMPQVTRSKMRDNIQSAIGTFEDDILPSLETADELFGERKFLNPENKRFDDVFKREISGSQSGNFYRHMRKGTKTILENLLGVSRLVEKSEETVTREMITVMNINLMQLTEAAEFTARYMNRLLNVSLAREIATIEKGRVEEDVSKPLLRWLDANRDVFLAAYGILSKEANGFNRKLKEIPDVVVNEQTISQQTATLGSERLDPLQLGLVPVRFNPFFRIGMVIAEWQAQRLLASRAERDVIALRLVRLNQLEQETGGKDLQVKRDIEVTQSRLERLEYRISDMEDDYNA